MDTAGRNRSTERLRPSVDSALAGAGPGASCKMLPLPSGHERRHPVLPQQLESNKNGVAAPTNLAHVREGVLLATYRELFAPSSVKWSY